MQKLLLIVLLPLLLSASPVIDCTGESVIHSVKEIKLPDFPDAFNPSIALVNGEIFLSFRYIPDLVNAPWHSLIGIVKLDENLDVISTPKILNYPKKKKLALPTSEDARLFTFKDKLYIIYNEAKKKCSVRRDMFIAEVDTKNYKLLNTRKLYHGDDRHKMPCQKNWSPFEYAGNLLFTYKASPHDIIYPELETGECFTITPGNTYKHSWDYGTLRGGTPALKFNGENLAFFHSSLYGKSVNCTEDKWHYFMGAYCFKDDSTFEVTKMTMSPLTHPCFYEPNVREKFVIFPGGFIIEDKHIHIAYGKDDCEIWIGTVAIDALESILIDVNAPS